MSNPLYRYLYLHGKSRHKKRGVQMARKKHYRSYSSGGKLSKGFIHPTGLIAAALLGAGAATLADNIGVSNAVPFGKYIAGFAVGGIGGVGGVFVRDMIKGGTGTTAGSALLLG